MKYEGFPKPLNKVIDGRGYNTRSAKILAIRSFGKEEDDPTYCEEALFIKKTGEYFLYVKGEPESKYSQRIPGTYIQDCEGIVPLSVAEAREWAEANLEKKKFETIFGLISNEAEIERHPQISILIPQPILDRLRKQRDETGISVTALIIKALRDAGYNN